MQYLQDIMGMILETVNTVSLIMKEGLSIEHTYVPALSLETGSKMRLPLPKSRIEDRLRLAMSFPLKSQVMAGGGRPDTSQSNWNRWLTVAFVRGGGNLLKAPGTVRVGVYMYVSVCVCECVLVFMSMCMCECVSVCLSVCVCVRM